MTTDDLRAAVAEATGDPLDWFFDEWIYGAGHPVLDVAYHFDDRSKSLRIVIEQRQRVTRLVPLFRMPVAIKIVTARETVRERFWIKDRRSVFVLPLSSPPRFVRTDDGGWLLAEIRDRNTKTEWMAQFQGDDDPLGRLEALEGLSRTSGGQSVVAAIARAALDVQEDSEVRTAAVRALETLSHGARARVTVLAALEDPDPHVQEAAAEALGGFGADDEIARRLESVVRGDRSYATGVAAVRALGRVLGRRGWNTLMTLAEVPSARDVLRGAVFETLAQLDVARALPRLIGEATQGRSPGTRRAALQAIRQNLAALNAAGRLELSRPSRKTNPPRPVTWPDWR